MPPHTRGQARNVEQELQLNTQLNWKDYLKKIYYDPGHPASFQGVRKLYDVVKKEGVHDIPLFKVKQWLSDQEAFSLTKPIKRVFKRNKVVVQGLYDQFDADLIVIPKYAESNDGVQYLLVAIDVFSRYTWVEPLQNKTGVLVKRAFQKIFKQGRKPRRVRTDRGREFTNVLIREYFESEKVNVSLYYTSNEKQANFAERVIKTLKTKIMRYMNSAKTDRYIDVLPAIVRSYNRTEHKGINEAPVDMNEENEKKHWWDMYWPKEPYDKKMRHQMRRKVQFTFDIGDLVRITKTREALQREYDARWTGEIFKIVAKHVRQGLPIYKVTDIEGEKLEGTFYQSELQKVTTPEDQLFIVDEVLDKRTRNGQVEVLVKWKYYPKKFNKWVPEDQLN